MLHERSFKLISASYLRLFFCDIKKANWYNMKKHALSVLITIMILANGMAQKQVNWEVFSPIEKRLVRFWRSRKCARGVL